MSYYEDRSRYDRQDRHGRYCNRGRTHQSLGNGHEEGVPTTPPVEENQPPSNGYRKREEYTPDQKYVVSTEVLLLLVSVLFAVINYAHMWSGDDQLDGGDHVVGEIPDAISWCIFYSVMSGLHGLLLMWLGCMYACWDRICQCNLSCCNNNTPSKIESYGVSYLGAKAFAIMANALLAILCSRASQTQGKLMAEAVAHKAIYMGESLFMQTQIIGLVVYLVHIPVTASLVGKVMRDRDAEVQSVVAKSLGGRG
jgi:hypothetical protein